MLLVNDSLKYLKELSLLVVILYGYGTNANKLH